MKRSIHVVGLWAFLAILAGMGFPAAGANEVQGLDVGSLKSLRLAIQDLSQALENRYPQGREWLARLEVMETRYTSLQKEGTDAQRLALGREYAELRRQALLANPLVSANPILFVVRHQYLEDHHNTETMFQKGEVAAAKFQPGGALKVLEFTAGGTKMRTVLETATGVVRDPDVHFSGKKILFSMRKNRDDDYHIYEINADGTGLKQLTCASGVSDIDPIYLPDDSIVFTSTREPKYCMCNRHIMGNLYRMNADGANIHQISKNTLHDGRASLMPDGRILYDRWEYVDRNFGDAQGLWTCRPDGTAHTLYWKNNTATPEAFIHARGVWGTQQAIGVFATLHDPFGALALVDRRLGLEGRPPVVQTWPSYATNIINTSRQVMFQCRQFGERYQDPYPIYDSTIPSLSGKFFLCSRWGWDPVWGLWLVDRYGNEIELHAGEPGCFDPMPLAPWARPPVLPTSRDFNNGMGTFYVQNVYDGTHMKGVKPGSVKYLRVVESPEKRFWSSGEHWLGQGGMWPAMNWHDHDSKRILGTVPVEADGSVYFKAPSERFLFFQLLDKDGMMVQSMRSGTMVQSGERAACTGCHEDRLGSSPPKPLGLAMRRPTATLADWHGPTRDFSFMAEVQPVFNRNCVSCHDYGKPAGKKLNLAPDRTLVFNTAYVELWRKGYTGCIGAGPAEIQQAFSWGSHASKLVQELRARKVPEHKDLSLSAEDWDRIITWIDLNGVYYPTYASAYPDSLTGRIPLTQAELSRLLQLTGLSMDVVRDHARTPGQEVSFDRPELSPCLKSLDRNSAQYKEALAIVEAGRDRLSQRPRADMPGFQPCELDRKREEKYQQRRLIEMKVREAIRKGELIYDTH